MAGLNNIQIIGNLGSDPETRDVGKGSVTSFSVCVNEKYGERESQLWLRVSAWGKLGSEVCQRFLSKGRQVFVSGRLQVRAYDDKDGNKRTSVEVVAEKVVLIGGGGQKSGSAGDPPSKSADDDSDIPF